MPTDIVLLVMEFDPRCYVRNGILKRVVGALAKVDSRYSTLGSMLDDHARWAKYYAYERYAMGSHQVGTMIPIGRFKAYIVDVYDAEYYNSQTGEYFYDLIREWSYVGICIKGGSSNYVIWVYEL